MCYGCSPSCDNCKAKFVYCPQCGSRGYLSLDECLRCGYLFSEEDKKRAVEAWEQRHE